MDFLYYRPFSCRDIEKISDTSLSLCTDQVMIKLGDSILAYRPSTKFYIDYENDSGIIISGRVKKDDTDNKESLINLLHDLENDKWPLSNDYNGIFSGISFSNERICIFNDPIGLFHLFYCITEEYIVVATNLFAIQRITNNHINKSALLLEATAPEFAQYGRSTVLKNVYTLLPGECKVKPVNSEPYSIYDLTIKSKDIIASDDFAEELVNFINEDCKSYFSDQHHISASLSGGIDSRVNLAAILPLGKDLKLINYGRVDFIDSKIPVDIANKFNLPIDVLDACQWQFPEKSLVNQVIKESDSLLVNEWFALFNNQKDINTYPCFLLGDMCDILRAKGIKSLKSRQFRKTFYLKRFLFNHNLPLTPVSKNGITQYQERVITGLINSVERSLDFFKINPNEKDKIIEEIRSDIQELFDHIDRYNPSYIESYEELFGIFTHGRRSMGKQLNILKLKFTPEIPLLNLRIIRKVLNYSPISRYSDELTNKMFKHPSWYELGKFPTAQNPFISYNSNYFLMLLGWFLRSSIDQLLIKADVKSKGRFKRQRLFKSTDIWATYSYKGAFENFTSYFSEKVEKEQLVSIFEKRKTKESWPLAAVDLIPYVQAAYYLDTFPE